MMDKYFKNINQQRGTMLTLALMFHFPEIRNMKVKQIEKYFQSASCKDCEDYKMELCPGQDLQGEQVVLCHYNSIIEDTQHYELLPSIEEIDSSVNN